MHSLSYRALPLLLSFALLALMGVLRPGEVRPTPPATGGGAPQLGECTGGDSSRLTHTQNTRLRLTTHYCVSIRWTV